MDSISIVIPAYNEEKRIGRTLQRILLFCRGQKLNFEIILVADGCTDSTIELASKIYPDIRIIKNEENFGKGAAVKTGVLSAKNEWILFTDADNAIPIEELNKFFAFTNGYPIIIGSKSVTGTHTISPKSLLRKVSRFVFNILLKNILFLQVNDSQCGFKLFRRDVAHKLFSLQTIFGFSFDAEILFIAKKLKYPIKEVAVYWTDQPGSKVNFARDSTRMFIDLLKIKLNDLQGRYVKNY